MSTLIRTEIKLFLRQPVVVLLAVALPTLLLSGFAAIPVMREPYAESGGVSFVQYWAPSTLVMAIAILGLQTLPAGLAAYRERGILRRMSATPMRPVAVLLTQLLIQLLTAALGAVLLVAVAVLALDVPAPRHPLGFVLALLLGMSAVFSIGLLIAARAPHARTATAIGTVMFVAAMFFGGVYLPMYLLPDVLREIANFVPPGIWMIADAWTGDGPQVLPLAVMAGITVAATAAAAKSFRWE